MEIAVLSLTLRGLEGKSAQAVRLAERVHRSVPYPLFLVVHNGPDLIVTLAHKRWAQNEAGKVVLEGELSTANLSAVAEHPQIVGDFISSLALSRQSHRHLKALYQGWMNACDALNAGILTGVFRLSTDPEQAAARRIALQKVELLDAEISRLRNRAQKEKQLARQVELNLAIKRILASLEQHKKNL